jgi:hypothetical protein
VITTIDAGEFVPPGVHEGLQQEDSPSSPIMEASAVRPGPVAQRRSTSTYPSNSRGPRTTAPPSASGAEGTSSSMTKAFNRQGFRYENRHRHLRHQARASASPSSTASYGPWSKPREGISGAEAKGRGQADRTCRARTTRGGEYVIKTKKD